jgi:hypothetical protein
MDQINLFWFIDSSKLCVLPPPRQIPQWRLALPQLHEPETLSELFLIEEQSVWTLFDVTSECDEYKGFRCIDFNHGLFEVVIDLERERVRLLLLVKYFETVSMLFQGPK